MTDVVTLRTATPDEAPRLVALINRAFDIERFFVDHDRTSLEQVVGYLATGTFLVPDGAGEDLTACLYFERRGDRGYVGMLSVDPSLQGHGRGRQMMAAAERYAASLGCGAMDIRVVNLREELPPFYRSLGYVECGEEAADNTGATIPFHYILMFKELTS